MGRIQNLPNITGVPSDEFIEDIEDETEKKEVQALVEQYDESDGSWSQPSSI